MLFKELKRNLTKDYSGMPVHRVAVLGDSATQFLAKGIHAYGYEVRINFDVFEAEFDQLDRQVLDPQSELYRSHPESVVISMASEKLFARFAAADPRERSNFSSQVLSEMETRWSNLAQLSNARVI